jgi:DNA-binding NarL/FixJ family response regulator
MRIAIAEDAALFRAGLVRLLEDEGHQVCAEVGDGEALLAAVASQQPDVVVADIRMPPTFGKLGLPSCQTDNRRVLAVLRYLGS